MSEEITKVETTLREDGASQLGIWWMLWEGKSRQTDALATKNVRGDLCQRQPLSWEDTHSVFFLYSTALPLTACATDFSDDPTFSLEHCVKYPRKWVFYQTPWKPQGQIQISEWDLHIFLSTPRGKQDDIERQKQNKTTTMTHKTQPQIPQYHKTPRQGKILQKCLVR